MNKAASKPLGQGNKRTLRKARKLNRKRVLELASKGMNNAEIARTMGVNTSSVWRFLQVTEPERQALEQFKSGRADVFARIQGKSLDLQERILESIDDHALKALTSSQKSGLLHVLNAQTGTLYDKERLESGKSTQNVGLIARMMGNSLDRFGKDSQADEQAGEAEDRVNQ